MVNPIVTYIEGRRLSTLRWGLVDRMSERLTKTTQLLHLQTNVLWFCMVKHSFFSFLFFSLPFSSEDNAHRSLCTNDVQCENDLSSTKREGRLAISVSSHSKLKVSLNVTWTCEHIIVFDGQERSSIKVKLTNDLRFSFLFRWNRITKKKISKNDHLEKEKTLRIIVNSVLVEESYWEWNLHELISYINKNEWQTG